MTRRTHNLIGAIFCTATAALLTMMAVTGIGKPPMDGATLTQDVRYEAADLRG